MIEFLKLILDLATKAVPGMVSRSERDRSAQLGAELFLFYVQLNDALVTADQIVVLLELYERQLADAIRVTGQRRDTWVRRELLEVVRKQLTSIQLIGERLDDLNWELQVLDGKSVAALTFLLDEKVSALAVVFEMLRYGRLPLRIEGIMIDDPLTELPEIRTTRVFEFRDEAEASAISVYGEPQTAAVSDREALRQVRTYLAVRKPREELQHIRDNLEQLREAIASNFTIHDILLHAGDPRIAERQRYR
ncbi:hypothetical protein ACIA03_08380 [Nocardioides sp. NPDC051685]|uniref:hypothetical protein n=1 Tax=Nocardioides sp. NPDC051685 TaxID=3364334 RepID=UPI00378E7EF6